MALLVPDPDALARQIAKLLEKGTGWFSLNCRLDCRELETIGLYKGVSTEFWTLMLFTGWLTMPSALTPDDVSTYDYGEAHAVLAIPNREVRMAWERLEAALLDPAWRNREKPQRAPRKRLGVFA